ncbi:MAG: hypothetical protein SFU53_06320 [Terrimicrobiaceae bacterium]|nr:hypothetical protein [Terrimicrobiaceae bacterium]
MIYDSQEQYQSMLRAFQDLQAISDDAGREVQIGDPRPSDAARTFFLQCYHLKDWLKKDSRIGDPKAVERWINQCEALSIAADVCNSLKHAGLSQPPRSGKALEMINLAYRLDFPPGAKTDIKFLKQPIDGDTITICRTPLAILKGKPIATAEIILTLDGVQRPALIVARQCIQDWDQFLSDNGISFQKE